jgi:hypothetical protein
MKSNASFTLTKESLTWITRTAHCVGISRSALVELITNRARKDEAELLKQLGCCQREETGDNS